MSGWRRKGWQAYRETLERAERSEEELARAQREVEELKNLNREIMTEMQANYSDPVVPIEDAEYVAGIGKYIIPRNNTLNDHYRLVYDRSNELDFWPDQSPAFDSLVAQTFLEQAFSRDNHPKYFDYEPLRDNIATVRNYLLQQVTQGIDETDPKQVYEAVRKLEQMGREVGVALQRDGSPLALPFSKKLDPLECSVPGEGAAKIYEFLTEQQKQKGIVPLFRTVMSLGKNRSYNDWNLPPLEQSPFSAQHVQDFCYGTFATPHNPSHLNQTQLLEVTAEAKKARQQAEALLAEQEAALAANPPAEMPPDAPAEPAPLAAAMSEARGLTSAQRISVLGAAIAGSAFSLDRVKRLPKPVQDRSVELARDILDKLRINASSQDRDQWLTQTAEESLAQSEAINTVATLYADAYQAALAVSPDLKMDTELAEANLALGKLAYLTKLQAIEELIREGKPDDAQMLEAELVQYPESWQELGEHEIPTLFEKLRTGLDKTHAAVQYTMQQQVQGVEQTQQPAMVTEIATPQLPLQPAHPVHTHNGHTVPDEELKALLQRGGLSAEELETVRRLQTQAVSMPEDVRKQLSHATQVGHSNAADITPKENFRAAASQHRDAEMSVKR